MTRLLTPRVVVYMGDRSWVECGVRGAELASRAERTRIYTSKFGRFLILELKGVTAQTKRTLYISPTAAAAAVHYANWPITMFWCASPRQTKPLVVYSIKHLRDR